MSAHRVLAAALPDHAAARPGNDPIFALNAEANRRAAAGESILNSTLGALMTDDGRLATMGTVTEAFQRVAPERGAAYAPIAGDPPFLAAVIADLFGTSEAAGQAVAVATPGGTGALHHAVMNFLEPGQRLLTGSYFWGPYRVIAEHAGRGVETFEMFGPDLRLDVDAFERGLTEMVERQGRALVVFNFPCHNPTGYSLDADEWAAVADVVARAGARAPVAFLLDHAYARFGPEHAGGWLPQMPRLTESATVLIAWTASKSFCQYGARVGALVAVHPDADTRLRIANALNYSCRATFSNCNHLGLLAVQELLTDPDLARRASAERAGLVRLLDERVQAFNDAAAGTGLVYPRYEGGFFVSAFTADGEKAAATMREDGVYVVPGPRALRVALCATPKAAVPRLVESLVRGVAAAG
ncbi:MAG: aminotransferase class I/II-fold pyridoxal phosphate-dependent enzyme [Gemmatimonadota bacterium]|nr:aminotransferase class I/II-fold pyridoxal phosphate-dependent enzyme [Gemmatimonadota bacterium]